jgi:hypothetical protein
MRMGAIERDLKKPFEKEKEKGEREEKEEKREKRKEKEEEKDFLPERRCFESLHPRMLPPLAPFYTCMCMLFLCIVQGLLSF